MRTLAAVLAVALLAAHALADTWGFPPERTTKEYEFGEVKIELVRDAREDNHALFDTEVTPEGVKKLQEALPNCEIAY